MGLQQFIAPLSPKLPLVFPETPENYVQKLRRDLRFVVLSAVPFLTLLTHTVVGPLQPFIQARVVLCNLTV